MTFTLLRENKKTDVTSEYNCGDKVNKHTRAILLSAGLTLEAGFKQKRTI